MSTCLVDTVADYSPHGEDARHAGPDGRVDWGRLLSSFAGPDAVAERRHDQRYPYSRLITLYPVNPDYSPCGEGPLLVMGKNISEGGLCFYHTAAVPERRVIADFEVPGGARLAVLTELTWCRFTRQGWYENGGRFLQIVNVGDHEKNDAPTENAT